ncbi:glutathione S-transferase family protein [Paraburkholderia rhynchosiae]|uniref:Glutathione S-transferase n=1 Tax=Paraburkholderia rhynchosiae TaxID=487049 RepID=A0A2N7W6W7_9BURK|nr:glutathione S-transferase family protein [Paraburkholderia rhynchosiae]PMS25147.1 glutathione S-transferase [Paraburkholderia rhynchosiae]CAB3714650.1 Glutathione S-transferase GST-4.5 [Paraburkholderia rhynchosiae]
MSYTLFYSPGAASMAVHWMLIELGVDFETQLVDIDSGAQRTPAYLQMNPTGTVPTLIVDGVPRHESAALLMLLAERHPAAGLAPSPASRDRAEWLELMIYLANTLLPAMRDWFYAGIDGDAIHADAVKALAQRRIESAWDRLNSHLADGRAYLVHGKLSTVDLLAVTLMRWSRNMRRPATTWQHLSGYIERLRALPSFIDVNQREGLTDWSNSTGRPEQ